MTDILIRESRPGDGAGCAAMWREFGGFMAAINPGTFQVPALEGLAEWFEEINVVYREDEALVLFVAELDGVLVGSVSASLHEPLDTAGRQVQRDLSRRRLHVDGLGVVESQRRRGVGSALMRAVEEWGRSRGAQVVTLETESNNPLSVPFYAQRMGFTEQAVIFRKEIASR